MPNGTTGVNSPINILSPDTAGLSNQDQPDATCPSGGQCFTDVTSGNPFYAFVNRIYQQNLVTGYPCGGPGEPCDSSNRPYYRPLNNVTRQQMAKFIDNARRLSQIDIEQASGDTPIVGRNDTGTAIAAYSTSGQALLALSQSQVAIYAQTGNSTAISGFSTGGTNGVGVSGNGYIGLSGTGHEGVKGTGDTGGYGVWGYNNASIGVYGSSNSGNGVEGSSNASIGVYGSSNSGTGVYGTSASGWAGYFQGNVNVTGTCCDSGAGTYKIDDPLNPANQYLYNSAVQSPDMMDIYNGNVTTDDKGKAIVTMPPYFQALNRDFRYQLTVIGQFAQAIVSSEIADNSFSIETDKPNVKVSWQVTGIRQDAYANAHRTPVEVAKPAGEQGKYLYPTELGQPASLGVNYQQQTGRQAIQSKP